MKNKKFLAILLTFVLLGASLYQPSLRARAAELSEEGQPETAISAEMEQQPEMMLPTEATGLLQPGTQTASVSGGDAEMPDPSMDEWVKTARTALSEIVQERDIMALVYLSDQYPVRVAPTYDSEAVITVLSGQLVDILDMTVTDAGEFWAYVRLEYQDQVLYGYVPRANLACSDTRFLNWELEYGMYQDTPRAIAADGQTGYADIEQFPESYRPALIALKEQHPNWTFVAMNTGLDWNTAVYSEMQGGRSLVSKNDQEWMKDSPYGDGNWYYATEEALKLYMDPRNHLADPQIFQFEQLTYNEEYHTYEAVERFLNNTFMHSGQNAPETSMTYTLIFWALGKEDIRQVSPFHLAARVLQEQGQGTSPLISGTYPGFEKCYNYFNIGASGKTNAEVIINGLTYAKEHGWTNAYLSIQGGADLISANYIRKGQDTLYLEKFNVNPSSPYGVYNHQYMQYIVAPWSEARSIRSLYAGANSVDNTFVFKIPVYENMPDQPCGIPEKTTDVSLILPAGYTDTTIWLDGVAYQGTMKDGKLVAHAVGENAKTAVVYQYNESGVPVGMYVWSLRYNGLFYVATAEPELTDLLTYHGFSIRITGRSGIRFKTGVSVDKRAQLISTGVNGYVLKEYGTLVMNNTNRIQYPMILGGEKVVSGLSYGVDANGARVDVAYEMVDGRYRYTSVLVGIPASQYKTEYAFRGYAVLEKNGQQIVLYGPAMARSIYSLAEQLLAQGSYAEGSDAYVFLHQLIADADALEQAQAAGEENGQ